MTELQRIESSIEDIKNSFELILNTSRDDLLQHTRLFIDSSTHLESIMPKITKYKIQLKKPINERPYGPNTTKRIISLIEKFEILYSVYQDELEPIFPDRIDEHDIKVDTYQDELNRRIEECQLQTRMEIESANVVEDTMIKIGENLDKIIINEVHARILNEIKRIDVSNRIELLNTGIENINIGRNHVIELFEQIYQNPELLQLRVLRIGNELLQERILIHKGGIMCLLAIGFQLKYGNEIADVLENLMDPKTITNEAYLYLEEPPVEDFDNWEKWRNHIKIAIEKLKSI